MKFGISSAVFYPLETEKSIEKLLGLGFDTFEMFYNCDYEISEEFLSKIKKLCGIANIISVHPYTAFAEAVFLFSAYERRTQENLDKYKRVFEASAELGAKFFTLHGDRAPAYIKDSRNIFSGPGAEVLGKLSDAAKSSGITLCLENVSWCNSSKLDYLKAVSQIENIGFTLDLKQARRAGIPFEDYLDVMGSKLCNIHISDYDEDNDCILPGKGKFDFEKLFKKTKEIGYRGDFLIEVYSSGFSSERELSESKKFLEGVAF